MKTCLPVLIGSASSISLMRILAVIGFGTGCLLLAADEPKQKAQVSKTERIDFPSGGTLRLTNSVGVLTVEGWDRPDVEITTIKSTKFAYDARGREKALLELDKVRVAAERRGDELVVTTYFPRWRAFPPPNPLGGETNFDLEYRIKAPSTARLIANHDVGEVNIDSLVSDIQVTLLQGEMMLHLPKEGRYDIHAKSDFGAVNSDFPGQEKRRWWLLGHRTVYESTQASHKLNLTVGFGDIFILKTRVPKPPGPLTPASKSDGL
jgi:hypothetical protein